MVYAVIIAGWSFELFTIHNDALIFAKHILRTQHGNSEVREFNYPGECISYVGTKGDVTVQIERKHIDCCRVM